ncbi:multidrug resistance-associated protein 2 [Actinidia rufa]|uniref:Multidrug resistance-associated protein 2 n=1 Tax=Actinidia rufa TaxID=165716 RepID=A0A7J0DQZ4_9ERIC|nr:multidrug resistance-associated protein 2 [Actinidia rufa]
MPITTYFVVSSFSYCHCNGSALPAAGCCFTSWSTNASPSVPCTDSEESNSSNKPISKAPNSRAKCPAECEKSGKESQRKKVKVSNGDAEEKKNPIQRLWNEDDEIVIIKGMIDYQSKKGAYPNTDMGAFHEFIKKSLHDDVSRNQLMDKFRRLKKY